MPDTILQSDTSQDVVIVYEEHSVRVPLPYPFSHLQGNVFAQTLLIIIAMDHLVIQIVFCKTAAIT